CAVLITWALKRLRSFIVPVPVGMNCGNTGACVVIMVLKRDLTPIPELPDNLAPSRNTPGHLWVSNGQICNTFSFKTKKFVHYFGCRRPTGIMHQPVPIAHEEGVHTIDGEIVHLLLVLSKFPALYQAKAAVCLANM